MRNELLRYDSDAPQINEIITKTVIKKVKYIIEDQSHILHNQYHKPHQSLP